MERKREGAWDHLVDLPCTVGRPNTEPAFCPPRLLRHSQTGWNLDACFSIKSFAYVFLILQQVAFNLDGHEKTIWDLRLSADERTLYSASADRTARVWRVNDGLVRGCDRASDETETTSSGGWHCVAPGDAVPMCAWRWETHVSSTPDLCCAVLCSARLCSKATRGTCSASAAGRTGRMSSLAGQTAPFGAGGERADTWSLSHPVVLPASRFDAATLPASALAVPISAYSLSARRRPTCSMPLSTQAGRRTRRSRALRPHGRGPRDRSAPGRVAGVQRVRGSVRQGVEHGQGGWTGCGRRAGGAGGARALQPLARGASGSALARNRLSRAERRSSCTD